jgi:hypothetical protein
MGNIEIKGLSEKNHSATMWVNLLFFGVGTTMISGCLYLIWTFGVSTEESSRAAEINNGVYMVASFFISYGMRAIFVLGWLACFVGTVGIFLARRKSKAS